MTCSRLNISGARSMAAFGTSATSLTPALLAYPDNMMFETDFPHPTCQHPGPQTPAVEPAAYAESALGSLPEDILQKVLVSTAAGLYGVTG